MSKFPLKTPLVKVSATGNDFLLIDLTRNAANWDLEGAKKSRPDWVREWCDRHQGIGADGAFFIEPHPEYDFAWDFYNSDGSPAEMCGNAARAAGLYMAEGLKKTALTFLTRTGPVEARRLGPHEIEVTLAPITDQNWNQWSEGEEAKLGFDFVRAGVPHAVLRVPEIEDRDSLKILALQIKREPRFRDQGTNVTFVRPRNGDRLDSVTFERGVEDFTLSCGTGAVAAAHSLLRGEENRAVEVRVPGGILFVIWKNGRPQLRGPARVVAEIRWFTGG